MMSADVSSDRLSEVDLSKPLLAQVGALGEDYNRWVHHSVSPKAAAKANARLIEADDPIATRWPESLRIFDNS